MLDPIWPVLMRLSLSVWVLVLSTCCTGPMERVPYWAPMDFFSGQGLCVLYRQSVVQMGRYTQALGGGFGSWRPSCVLMDEKRGGSIRWRWVNGVVVYLYAKIGFIVHLYLTVGPVPASLLPLPLHLLVVTIHFGSGSL